jgi:hypothetical protein
MNEATIIIAGKPLTQGQSMAVRVAVTNMLTEMTDPVALGNDPQGREMTAGYHARLTEVISLILRGA